MDLNTIQKFINKQITAQSGRYYCDLKTGSFEV